MSGLTNEQLKFYRNEFLGSYSRFFESNQALTALFLNDEKLKAYARGIPEATSLVQRIEFFIAWASTKTSYGVSVLDLALRVMKSLEDVEEEEIEPAGQTTTDIIVPQDRAVLRRYLTNRFSLSNLKILAFDVGLDTDNLPHQTKEELSAALLVSLTKNNKDLKNLKLFFSFALDEAADQTVKEIINKLVEVRQ